MDRRIGTSVMSSNGKGAAPVCCGEEGAELDGEAFSLLVHLCSKPHLWLQIWVVTQRMRSWIHAAEIILFQRVRDSALGIGGGAPPSRGSLE